MADASKNNTDGYTALIANNGDFGDMFWECKEQEQSRSAEGSMKVNGSEKNAQQESQKETGSKWSKSKDSASYKKYAASKSF